MRGTVKTYLPEKGYGFLKGDDGKDYFFHNSELVNKESENKVYENAFIEFDQVATPKGYKAIKCKVLNPKDIDTYVTPDVFLTSKTRVIKGWEVVEEGQWYVYGSSEDSPEAAKNDVINCAITVGANALIELEYYKTKGSKLGTGQGIYNFTIHNFRGIIAKAAKKNASGTFYLKNLLGINKKASLIKNEYLSKKVKAEASYNKFFTIISIIGFSSFIITHVLSTSKILSEFIPFSVLIITLTLLFIPKGNTSQDWLVEIPESNEGNFRIDTHKEDKVLFY